MPGTHRSLRGLTVSSAAVLDWLQLQAHGDVSGFLNSERDVWPALAKEARGSARPCASVSGLRCALVFNASLHFRGSLGAVGLFV